VRRASGSFRRQAAAAPATPQIQTTYKVKICARAEKLFAADVPFRQHLGMLSIVLKWFYKDSAAPGAESRFSE
jgi:hypothetical protein